MALPNTYSCGTLAAATLPGRKQVFPSPRRVRHPAISSSSDRAAAKGSQLRVQPTSSRNMQ
eukprot:13227754-Alexandrium_andersonii.AAC.1